jgi:hypothetical protein
VLRAAAEMRAARRSARSAERALAAVAAAYVVFADQRPALLARFFA